MKYIVYKATGGLFHNLRGCERAIQLALEHDVILIIDMQSHVGWNRFNDYFTVQSDDLKYYDNYDTVPHYIENVETGRASRYGYNKHNNNYELNFKKDLNVVYGCQPKITPKLIKVNDEYFDKIKSNNPPINEKFIAVHFRNTDKKNDIKQLYMRVEKAVTKHNIHTLYLATDDSEAKIKLQKRFPQLKLIQKVNPPSNVKNIHYNHPCPETQMFESIQDLYNIFTSDVFIPSKNSAFSNCPEDMIRRGYTLFPGLVSNAIIER